MIQCENLSKSYGDQNLFDNVSFQISSNEKVGLVGRNGYGKTTLFRIITGEEESDSGIITIPKNYSIGYVKQHLTFSKNSILEEAALGLPKDQKDDLWLAEKILFGLGFNDKLLNMLPSQISGGYQVRLNLAKTLLSNPNMLLLDEPTNYLDITSIRWLIRFLQEWKGELLFITHDRSFMDEIATHIMAIHRKKVKKLPGKTENLYEQIAMEEEVYEKQRINDEKKRKQSEIYINRFRAKARLAGLIQSRIKILEKQERKEKLEKMKSLDFQFSHAPFNAHVLLTVNNLSFSYEKDKELINNLTFTVNKNDRIAIIGPNGKGKSTLLKLLNESLILSSGEIKKHSLLKIGSFGQTNESILHPENTVEQEIANSHPEKNIQIARNISGVLLFEGDNALKKIKVLSGGEKSRVLLGKILVNPVNLLLLDEPTNHLDMESSDALLAAIDDFEGAVIIVTHNEMFLRAIANRLIVFDNNKIVVYESTYNEFLENIGWSSENDILQISMAIDSKSTINPNKKDLRKKRAEIIEEKSKVIKPIEKKYKEMETYIIQHEEELKKIENDLMAASQKGKGIEIGLLSKRIHELEKIIQEEYVKLDEIMYIYEKETKFYDRKLENLEF